MARAYGNVYVAQISMGANDTQATKALLEADAYPGTSLVIAYSTCIAHGIDMSKSMSHQKDAVRSGYWPLYRFHPSPSRGGSALPARLQGTVHPPRRLRRDRGPLRHLGPYPPPPAARLAALAQADIDERWRYYEQLAAVHRRVPTWTGGRASRSTADAGYQYDEEVRVMQG